jgi:nucleolar protein 6
MPITKDATSRKRKLTVDDQNEVTRSPRKSRILTYQTPNSKPHGTFNAGHALQATDDEHKARLKPPAEKNAERSACKSYVGGGISDATHSVKDAKSDQPGDQVHSSEGTAKAALRQAKSERRSKKRKNPDVAGSAPETESRPTIEQAVPAGDDLQQDEQQDEKHVYAPQQDPSNNQSKSDSKQRFIVFIGNLPYTATTPAIQSHFSKLQPFTVRHSTNKETGRSRGFAFLEFEGYDKMKTCLKLFHHSLFDASAGQPPSQHEKGKKSQARKINVELTAGGGGGKSAARKERIKEKNEKLEGERERARVHKEKEEAAAIRKKKRKAGDMTGANAVQVTERATEDENMHPSRRKRMET